MASVAAGKSAASARVITALAEVPSTLAVLIVAKAGFVMARSAAILKKIKKTPI